MEKGWKQVFLTTSEYQAAIAQSVLSENGIPSVLMDQKDSTYKTFGEIAVFVEESFEAKAIELLKELTN